MSRRKRGKGKQGTGSIQQQGGGWRIRWREKEKGADGKQRSVRKSATFADKVTAENVLRKIVGEIAAKRKPVPSIDPAANPEPPPEPSAATEPPTTTPTIAELGEAWLQRRELRHRNTGALKHRNWRGDRSTWARHIVPTFGHRNPDSIDAGTSADLIDFIDAKLATGLSPQTVGNVMRLFGKFFADAKTRKQVKSNPVADLPPEVKELYKSTYDPTTTPHIKWTEDIQTVYRLLAEPFATLFMVGVLTGLRPGEMIGLEWSDIDIAARRILVARSVRLNRVGTTKNGKVQPVPFSSDLVPILSRWKLATGGEGLVFKPLPGQRAKFISDKQVRKALKVAFKAAGLPEDLGWYGASRHTMGRQLVKRGGSLVVAQTVLRHSTSRVTQRYTSMDASDIRDDQLLHLGVDLSRESGQVIDMAAHRNEAGGTEVGLDGVDRKAGGGVST